MRIESIMLDGLPLDERHEPALRAALTNELQERFGRRERFAAADLDRLPAGDGTITGTTPGQLGAEIGRAVHGSLPRNAE